MLVRPLPETPQPRISLFFQSVHKAPRGAFFGFLTAFAAVNLCGCAQQPQRVAAGHGKEYFPSSIYGKASPRVVADGEPVPRGGGSYLVGKPYTVAGHTYYPSEKRYAAVGLASWYGDAFHGRRTANGEIYDKDSISAAHPTMPLPSYARVTNLRNHYSMIVRVNDRGPFAADRIMDVSRRVAQALDFKGSGTAKVKVEYIGNASLAGSDDQMLLASLRYDGVPASLGGESPSMVAEAKPRPPIRTASADANDPGITAASYAVPAAPARNSLGRLIEKETGDDSGIKQELVSGSALSSAAPLPPARPFDLGSPMSATHPAQIAKR